MKRSGDRVIWRSGDLKGEFTAETRSRGESQEPTTEARRHGEESSNRVIAPDRGIGKTRAFFSTVRGALRELFDESAYDRFLLRTNVPRSVASYRAFTRERDASMQKKPRCC
jgi:hypothetical protein